MLFVVDHNMMFQAVSDKSTKEVFFTCNGGVVSHQNRRMVARAFQVVFWIPDSQLPLRELESLE